MYRLGIGLIEFCPSVNDPTRDRYRGYCDEDALTEAELLIAPNKTSSAVAITIAARLKVLKGWVPHREAN